MKKTILFISIISIINIPIPKAMFTDYRDDYVGSYFCKRRCQSLNSDHSKLNIKSDTITVIISKDSDSLLNVSMGKSTLKVKIIDGIMYPYPQGNNIKGKFFSTDSISFGIIASHVGNVCGYEGSKKID